MNVIEALNSRHSVRTFTPTPLDRATLVGILVAANRCPSWADTQPWEIFVAGGEPLERLRAACLARFDQGLPGHPDLPRPQSWPPPLQQRMAENTAQRSAAIGIARADEAARRASARRNHEFFGAPVVVYLCIDRTLTPWSIFDLGMMAQSIMLAAQEFGVDSIPAVNLIAYPDLLRSELGIPDDLMIVIGIALGYADPTDPVNRVRSLRRPAEDFVRFVGL